VIKDACKKIRSKPIELSIVVPTYMEAENIPELVERVENALKELSFEIIIIDDNSPDGTADLAEKFNDIYGNIKVLRRPGKLGLGSAVLEGFRKAESEVLAIMDADLQHPPELLPQMYRKVQEGYSLVIASRYVDGGGVEGLSFLRKIISLGAVKLAHLILPKTRNIKDPMSGFFMLKREAINDVELSSRGFKMLLEILIKGKQNSVVEVPYTFKLRRKGKSKLNLKEIFRYAFLLIKLRVKL
jgi:dolichol-phosphate mannosyltransferase